MMIYFLYLDRCSSSSSTTPRRALILLNKPGIMSTDLGHIGGSNHPRKGQFEPWNNKVCKWATHFFFKLNKTMTNLQLSDIQRNGDLDSCLSKKSWQQRVYHMCRPPSLLCFSFEKMCVLHTYYVHNWRVFTWFTSGQRSNFYTTRIKS